MGAMNQEKRRAIVRDLAGGVRQYLVAHPGSTRVDVVDAMMGVMSAECRAAGDCPALEGLIIANAREMFDDAWALAHEVDPSN